MWQILTIVLSVVAIVSTALGVFFANTRNKFTETERTNYEKAVGSYKTLVEAKDEQIKQQKEDMREMRELHTRETKELRIMHTDSMQQIGKLQGQVDTYSKLPLGDIAAEMRVITEIQLLIAKTLKVKGLEDIVPDSKLKVVKKR